MSNILVKMVVEGKAIDTRAHFWCWHAWFILYDLKESIILVVEGIYQGEQRYDFYSKRVYLGTYLSVWHV